ncbi:unnamed protein product [Rhizoctonia solani]|uniref:Major facilitator superfamily (MFS) profile domain-containing protein n=1 Tax=Rhizoctonia solani TaxID=456999 RepID=A0A8H3CM33_9AGAM|nr:unnamed protein product [Rhizoctonia solani]
MITPVPATIHETDQLTTTAFTNPVPDQDIEKLTLHINSILDPGPDSPEEKVEELGDLQTSSSTVHSTGQGTQDPFTEGGLEGWKAVLGCTLVVAATAGWNMMWGVFQAYHSKTLLRGTPDATLSAIGATQNALMTGLAFITGKLGDKYGYKRFIGAGCIVVFLGQFGAAWCHSLWSIFLTQGVLQGLGCGLLLPMIFAIPSQWFRRRRGVATGIVIAGSSMGAAIPSLVVQTMLEHIGFHKTLLIYSFVQGATMLVGFLFIRVRLPESQTENKTRKIVWVDKQYFKDPIFWSFCTALVFTIFGFMIPFVFISVYTREKLPHITDELANLPISVMAFASAIGRTTVGHIGDRIGFVNVFILVILASSFCQAVLWNVTAESYAGIMVFSKGCFSG